MLELSGFERVLQYPTQVLKNPMVSICIQTYNHEKFINKCLGSILMQKTNFEFEILVGEDYSQDNTRNICINYAKKHPKKIRLFLHNRMNVIYIDNNPTGRFNLLYNFNQANGKYIALCEGDDYWTDPLKLQKQVDFMENNHEYSLCVHECSYVNIKGDFINHFSLNSNRLGKKAMSDNSLTLKLLLSSKLELFHTSSYLFKRDAIYDLPKNFTQYIIGDIPLLILISNKGKIYYIADNMSAYRQHQKGISKNRKNIKNINNQLLWMYNDLMNFINPKYHKYLKLKISRIKYFHLISNYEINSNLKNLYEILLYRKRLKLSYKDLAHLSRKLFN